MLHLTNNLISSEFPTTLLNYKTVHFETSEYIYFVLKLQIQISIQSNWKTKKPKNKNNRSKFWFIWPLHNAWSLMQTIERMNYIIWKKKWSKNLGIANDMIYQSQEEHFKSLLYRSLKFDKTRNKQNVVAIDEQQNLHSILEIGTICQLNKIRLQSNK